MSTTRRIQLILPSLLAVLSPVILLNDYFSGNWYSFFHSYSLGMFFGLPAFMWFCIVLVLACRIRILDKLYGHDRVIIFHGYLAFSALLFALTHAILKFKYFGLEGIQVLLGISSLVLYLTITIVTCLLMIHGLSNRSRILNSFRNYVQRKWGVDYSGLKFVHNGLSIAAALMVTHVLMASSTNEKNSRIAMIWVFGLTGLSFYVYHKLIRPLLLWRRSLYLRENRPLNGTVVELSIAPVPRSFANARAGQFAYIRLISSRCGWEEHPFTISSPPGSSSISLTIKDLGNYTHSLKEVEQGTRVLLDGPYGIFNPRDLNCPHLFVAGGIGITPFLSIIRDMDNKKINTPVTLVWSARSKNDFVHDDILRDIASRNKWFRYVSLVSDDGQFVTREILENLFDKNDFLKMQVFFCGPDPMRRVLQKIMREAGLPRGAFHFERFAF